MAQFKTADLAKQYIRMLQQKDGQTVFSQRIIAGHLRANLPVPELPGVTLRLASY